MYIFYIQFHFMSCACEFIIIVLVVVHVLDLTMYMSAFY